MSDCDDAIVRQWKKEKRIKRSNKRNKKTMKSGWCNDDGAKEMRKNKAKLQKKKNNKKKSINK